MLLFQHSFKVKRSLFQCWPTLGQHCQRASLHCTPMGFSNGTTFHLMFVASHRIHFSNVQPKKKVTSSSSVIRLISALTRKSSDWITCLRNSVRAFQRIATVRAQVSERQRKKPSHSFRTVFILNFPLNPGGPKVGEILVFPRI